LIRYLVKYTSSQQ